MMESTTRKPNHYRFSIFRKMLLLVSLCTLIPLAGSAFLSVRRGIHAVEGAARKNLELVAQVTATRLDQLFMDTSRMQAAQAHRDIVVNYCESAAADRKAQELKVMRRMNEVLASNPDLAMMFLTDDKGICLISTSPNMVGNNYKEIREYMRQALAGKQYISDLAMGTTSREPGVFLAGPVYSVRGNLIGTVVLKLKGSVIDGICNEVSNRIPRGFAAVVDAFDVIIFHPDRKMLYHSMGTLSPTMLQGINPQLQYGVKQIESAGMDEVLKELHREVPQGNVTFTSENGTPYIGGYARMKQRPWKVNIVQPLSEFDHPLRRLAWQQAGIIAGVGLVSVLAAMGIAHRLVRPIRSLTAAGARAAEGDWSARAQVSTHDELADLANTFNDMMPKLKERAAMEEALRLANEIQQHLLPQGAPSINGLEVAGTNLPADQTGGDYYDFLDLSAWQNGTLAVAVGDVTGHGIPAALLMATARALLRSRATPPGTLEALMADVNRRLCDDSPDERFMTMMYAVIDRQNRQVRLVSAGQDPIILLDPQTGQTRELEGQDIPLGVDSQWAFNEVTYASIPEGAILLIGTDGIWETRNPQGEMFGKQRLIDIMRSCGHLSAKDITNAVTSELEHYRGGSTQEDDVTLVVIKFMPQPTA